MTQLDTQTAGRRLAMFGPVLLGATSFACADVLSKVTLNDGADPLTVSTVRGFVGLVLLYAWLRVSPAAGRHVAAGQADLARHWACCSPATSCSCSRRSR